MTNGALQFALTNSGVAVTSTSSLLGVTQVAAVAVPEPADWMLMLTGLVDRGLDDAHERPRPRQRRRLAAA